jgi:hypothetical protein
VDRNIKILHDSFPRSGNHFLEECLKMAFTNAEITWGFHKVHLLNNKDYDGIITSVRDPINCISSYMVLTNNFDKEYAKKVILWYKRFISETIKIKNNIYVCNFYDLIEYPEIIIKNFAKKYNITASGKIDKIVAIKNIKNDSSFVHKSNEKDKEFAKAIILNYEEDIKECIELYKNAIF